MRPALACLLLLGLASGPGITAGELGPAPRDEAGRFENPTGPLSHGDLSVHLPFLIRRIGRSFGGGEGAAARVANDGAFLRDNAGSHVATVTWVGHATLLVQMDGLSFLTDPIWSNTASPMAFAGPSRLVPPGISLEDLPPIDFVLVSHNHYDHLDLATLEQLAARSHTTRFLVPLENAETLRARGIPRVEELDWGESVQHGRVTVHCLPAQHWSQRGLFDRNRSLWASWAVVGPTRRFYFGGDTGYFEGFRAIGSTLGPFDLAALPIGAYEPRAMMREAHLNPEEAVQAGLDVRARKAVAIHFGTFDLADEALDEPPRRFRAAGSAAGLEVWELAVGDTRRF